MMNSKAVSCVHAIAAAGILMFSSYAATTAFGEDASGVPDSALKGKKVAYVACSDLNRWCREFRHQIVPALEAKGVIVTDLQDPYDPVLQAQHLDQAVAQKPDLIALLATNARSVVPGLRRAQAAGIPVINLVGPTVPESEPYFKASIENNHRQLGEFAATNLVEGLKKEGRTTANIFVVTGAQVQPEVAVRMDGFKSVMDKYPEYKIVDI
jgi:ribose transport system substrate-binding protein